jgi:hypothetical protein
MRLREIRGPAGRLEALLDEAAGVSGGSACAAFVLAHPHPQYGGTMHTKAVYWTAKALSRIGCAVFRFNFRGTGRSQGSFDEGAGERDDFGARSTSWRPRTVTPRCGRPACRSDRGSLSARAPAIPACRRSSASRRPCRTTIGEVALSRKPKFFVHGERAEVSSLKDIRAFYARAAEPKELAVIDAADHVFDGKVGEVADAIEDLLGDWSP